MENVYVFNWHQREFAVKEVTEMTRMLNVIPRFDVAFRPQTRLWDSPISDWIIPSTNLEECDWLPPSDIAETDREYHLTMELPGIDMKNLDISFSEGVLTVKGEKTKEGSVGESCYCSERYSGSFQRSFRIPGAVDKENIKAKYRDGILRVSLAKSEESVVKKIEIH
jgi:HSP20 family protein